MPKPLAIDLYCGLGGWTEGLLAEGYNVVGFDIERYVYGEHRYPAQLVLQDVLTIHGRQFKDTALIVASPPCQEYSYMAMPWSRAKQIEADYKAGVRDVKQLTALFDACFRIQREACEAAGRHIPLVVENVCGAQKWVGKARWHHGSFYLWGDIPALMPLMLKRHIKVGDVGWNNPNVKSKPFNGGGVKDLERFGLHGEGSYDGLRKSLGVKQGGDWFSASNPLSISRTTSGRSPARRAAAAMIAKIPLVLSRHIASVYKPDGAWCYPEARTVDQ
jgi:hypothetical protein